MKYIENLTSEDLTFSLKKISNIIGIDLTQKLMMELAGMTVFFPMKHTSMTRKKYLVKHFRGNNVEEMANCLECSPSTIYRLLGEKYCQ